MIRQGKTLKRAGLLILTASMAFAICPKLLTEKKVIADFTKTKENTRIGSSRMASPKKPAATADAWKGSYVYYGKYDGTPVKYRVLCPSTARFGVSSLFLDCDSILYYDSFDKDGVPNSGATRSNDWGYSDIRNTMNGSAFLNKANGFTSIERNSIAKSTIGSHKLNLELSTNETYETYTPLKGEKIFLLDIEDVLNADYGYLPFSGYSSDDWDWSNIVSRIKKCGGSPAMWWLRSAPVNYSSDVGKIDFDGYQGSGEVYYGFGVSPAFNVDSSTILFSSAVSGSYGAIGSEYKLTLKDAAMNVAVTSGKKVSFSGSKVTVPFTVSGSRTSSINQMSVLITDKDYFEEDANILYYGKVNVSGSINSSGTATFELPSDLSLGYWGIKYKIYLVPEDIRGNHETDYAGKPFKLNPALSSTTNLSAQSAGKNQVRLKWNSVVGADGYLVYAMKNSKYSYVGMTRAGYTYLDKNALDNDYNYYWVFPYYKDNNGTMITGNCKNYVYAKGVCAAVSNLKATSVSGGVKLTWSASSTAQGYLIYGITGSNNSYHYLGMASGTTYTDKTASSSQYNYYWVYPYHKDASGNIVAGLTGKYTYGRAL